MYSSITLKDVLINNPVIPRITINDLELLAKVINSLVEGGIKIVELNIDLSVLPEAVSLIKDINSNMIICVGAITSTEKFKLAEKEDVDFIVSPGISESLLKYASKSSIDFMPGVMSSSDVMIAREYGFMVQQLYPATAAGGKEALQAYSTMYSDVMFCPKGGVSSQNYKTYLSQKNVCAISGTWITTSSLIRSKMWEQIKINALKVQE